MLVPTAVSRGRESGPTQDAASWARMQALATSRDGTAIAYRRSGSGPSLLLVHGGGLDARQWDRLVPLLAHDRRLARRARGGSRRHAPAARGRWPPCLGRSCRRSPSRSRSERRCHPPQLPGSPCPRTHRPPRSGGARASQVAHAGRPPRRWARTLREMVDRRVGLQRHADRFGLRWAFRAISRRRRCGRFGDRRARRFSLASRPGGTALPSSMPSDTSSRQPAPNMPTLTDVATANFR